jgi:hypothetical protein
VASLRARSARAILRTLFDAFGCGVFCKQKARSKLIERASSNNPGNFLVPQRRWGGSWLNFRVRDGNRCDAADRITNALAFPLKTSSPSSPLLSRPLLAIRHQGLALGDVVFKHFLSIDFCPKEEYFSRVILSRLNSHEPLLFLHTRSIQP